MLLTQRETGSSILRAVLCDEGAKVGEQCSKAPNIERAVPCDEGAKVGEQCSKAPAGRRRRIFRVGTLTLNLNLSRVLGLPISIA